MKWLPVEQVRNIDRFYITHPRRWLGAIIILYTLLASNYAINTPIWQAPDEPAHYNYIGYIATHYRLPVLQMGDYNQRVLEQLLKTHFRTAELVVQLRYEDYQPPLYYLLATPVYWLSGGEPLAIRFFGVLIGIGIIIVMYQCLELVFPGKPLISVGATAFAAMLPMHMAVMAAINNDGLAELLVSVSLLLLLQWMHRRFQSDPSAAQPQHDAKREQKTLFMLGVVLGLGMLTKVYAYALLPIALLTIVVVRWRCCQERLAVALKTSLWTALPALVLSLPWWVRNWLLYGPGDILGTAWHDRVVIGQPRTVDWIARTGWEDYLERALTLTFRSFWGVFGWLGIFLDERLYTAMLFFTGVIFLGMLWTLVRFVSGGPDMDMDDFQLWVLGVFGIMLLAVLAGFVWYNLKFVQHQGRYFFWGLLPLSTFVALGWREVLRPFQGLITALLTGVMAFTLFIVGSMSGDMNKWTIATVMLIACFLLFQPLLLVGAANVRQPTLSSEAATTSSFLLRATLRVTGALRGVVWATPFLLLALLNLLIPLLYLLP